MGGGQLILVNMITYMKLRPEVENHSITRG